MKNEKCHSFFNKKCQAGVICMIEDKTTKKNQVTVFGFGTSHFYN